MSRLQKMKEVKGWELLDEYFDKPINGFHTEIHGFERSFCRCGSTDNKLRNKCDACGNYDFSFSELNLEKAYFYRNYVIGEKYYHKNKVDGLGNNIIKVYNKKLYFDVDSKREYVQFYLDKEGIAELHKDKIVYLNKPNYDFCSYLDEHKDDYKYWDLYEEYMKIFKNKSYTGPFHSLCSILNLQEKPHFLNDVKIFQFPNIAEEMIIGKNFLIENVSFASNVKKIFNIDEEYFSAIDYGLKTRSIYGYELNYESMKSFFKDLKGNETGFEKQIKHYLVNQVLNPDDARRTYKKIRAIQRGLSEKELTSYFGYSWAFYKPASSFYPKRYEDSVNLWGFFKKEYLKYFEIFMKENIFRIRNKSKLVDEFISTIKNMIDFGIPIKEENFKVKTYNFYLNKNKLSEHYNLPKEKVDLFLDLFDINPMESLELVKNRRKLSKKQLDSFIDYMSEL